MKTYSTLEAMELAKTQGGQFVCSRPFRDQTVYLHHQDDGLSDKWIVYTKDRRLDFIPDIKWQQGQPEIQVGDWFRNGAVYTRIIRFINNGRVMAKDFNQAPHESKGAYQEEVEAIRELEKVTNGLELTFLKSARIPGEWRIGDLAYSKKTDNVGEIFEVYEDTVGLRDIGKPSKEYLFPVCFVEDRQDRTDA